MITKFAHCNSNAKQRVIDTRSKIFTYNYCVEFPLKTKNKVLVYVFPRKHYKSYVGLSS